jgi:hypothetical protein
MFGRVGSYVTTGTAVVEKKMANVVTVIQVQVCTLRASMVDINTSEGCTSAQFGSSIDEEAWMATLANRPLKGR